MLASEQVKQKIADQIKEKLNNQPPKDLYASLSEAGISLYKEESFVTVRQKAEEILGRFEGLSPEVEDIKNINCDCWRETYIRAAATFEDQLDDMDAQEVKYVSGINKVTVTARLPLGDKFLQIEKVFEKSVDTEEYVQFLLNWKVDPFDARIIQTYGMKDCCSRIIGRTEENWRRSTPWVPALLADVMMGAPGTVYGWYTGDHWRTGEKLETWEQALGILDVVPGEALVKAGIVGLVSAYGVTLVKYANKAGKVLKVVKYTGYGGDIKTYLNRTTTLIGRYIDGPEGGTKVILDSKNFKCGENPGGLNLLDVPNWTWEKNKKWLEDVVDRGDEIRLVSDPKLEKNLYVFKDGKITDELTTFGKEVRYLESRGYRINGVLMVKK